MKGWKERIVVVTGGGSGIGEALALEMSRRGARLMVSDISGDAATRVAAACGAAASAHQLDVRDAESVRALIETAAAEHGRIDYLFNNAGISVGGEAQEIPLTYWERIVDVNLRGVIHGVTAAYPLMVKQGHGHIVNTASLGGLAPMPLGAPYSMTKHAVVGLSTSLRLEAAAHGVRVSVLCPSMIETPLLDRGNPSDLPAIRSLPDIRRYLGRLAGPPYPLGKFVTEALAAIEANRGVIVIPGRARLAWRLSRLAPWLTSGAALSAVRSERSARDSSD
jgi:NAD(P)-dependent dehydrogenase (short-subunit alcohol dehydrogenase family)